MSIKIEGSRKALEILYVYYMESLRVLVDTLAGSDINFNQINCDVRPLERFEMITL